MTISEVLIPELRDRFRNQGLQIGSSPDPIAVFPPAHPSIGEISIMDEGGEVLVYIGNITHSHFNTYDETLTPEQKVEAVSAMVINFLEDLFKDRVLLWGSAKGRGGSFHQFKGVVPDDIPKEEKLFVWSGPLSRS